MLKTQLRLHFIVLLWGFTGVTGKLVSFSALPLVFWRMLIATFVIMVLLLVSKKSFKINQKQLLSYIGVGFVIGLHWILFFGAIKVSNVSVALSTLSTGALFTAFLEPLFFKTRFKLYEVILSLIVAFCIWLIFRASPEYWLGILLGIACSFLSAIFSIFNAQLQKKPENTAQKMMFYEMLSGWILVATVLLFTGDMGQILDFRSYDLPLILVLGGLLTAYPMIESISLMKHISPFTLLLAVNLEPVYGIVLAYFIFGESETMSPLFYVASLIMILAIVANEIFKLKKRSKPEKQYQLIRQTEKSKKM